MDCKNGYSDIVEFSKYFGNEKDMKNCTNCTYFEYDNGISTCKLFNNTDKE